MTDLHLNLKGEYFDQIASGEKTEEYRLFNDYWTRRLSGRVYENIILKRGYPKSDDMSRQIIRPWQGYRVIFINHLHFGAKPVKVYAIKVNEEAQP